MEIVFILGQEIRLTLMIVKDEQQRGLDLFIVCDLLARGNIEFDRPLVIAIEEIDRGLITYTRDEQTSAPDVDSGKTEDQ